MYVPIDCCDGSDEYESDIRCPNTCKNRKDAMKDDDDDNVGRKHTLDIEDLIHKLRGIICVQHAIYRCSRNGTGHCFM